MIKKTVFCRKWQALKSTVSASDFTMAGAGVAQFWERSPPISVARVQSPDLALCW